MTKKEFQIIQEYVMAMVENGFSRCHIRVQGKHCGCINYEDVEKCIERIAILLDKKE